MSGIVGSRLNHRGSGLVGSLGTDGQVFTSAGAGKSAVYEAAASGNHVQLFSQESESSTSEVTVDNVFTSSYDFYHIKAFFVPGTDNVDFKLRARTGGGSGSTYTGSEYQWLWRGRYIGSSGGGGNDNGSYSDSSWKLADNVNSDNDSSFVSLTMDWFDPNTRITTRPHYNADCTYHNNSNDTFYRNYCGGKLKTNNNITGLTFYFSGGDVDEHKIVVYGVKTT